MDDTKAKAEKFINSIVYGRAPSEYRWLWEMFKAQKEVWEEFIRDNQYVNPFDADKDEIREKVRYYRHLIAYGLSVFRDLNF